VGLVALPYLAGIIDTKEDRNWDGHGVPTCRLISTICHGGMRIKLRGLASKGVIGLAAFCLPDVHSQSLAQNPNPAAMPIRPRLIVLTDIGNSLRQRLP